MITENTKKIFNNAGKQTERFVREVISAFPKFDVKQTIEDKKVAKLTNNKKEKY